jgi:hypothetical protein
MQFAEDMGLKDQFQKQLDYLGNYAEQEGCSYDKSIGAGTICRLYKDFAPHSFTFILYGHKTAFADLKAMFNGGLIYQGPTSPANGSFPSLTVSLNKGDGWFVHT